ncbi:uncharacterized protein LOC128275662 [Anopheles cruzii]|uniref:uncharacterized protein LOC128275662 n=1 Tax=Anopheles cruzii TaxID=68878 RepID=UPI0022EC7ADA|nr:uncharacterized protein LOC128275662 [Anopheles cruzii]
MAPFKLKFRMGSGSSRSTSQEQHAPVDSQTNSLGGFSNSSNAIDFIDESEQSNDNLVSMSNDQRALLLTSDTPDEQISGYDNPALSNTETANIIPLSPPPSYEYVLEENRMAALDKENNRTSLLSESIATLNLEHVSSNSLGAENSSAFPEKDTPSSTTHQESTDSSLHTFSSAITSSQENLLNCTGSCNSVYQLSCNTALQSLVEDVETMTFDETCLSQDNQEGLASDEECSVDSTAPQILYLHTGSRSEVKGPEILYKSSKRLYKAVAKECGISCKMSDQCRCLDCQSRYFDCEYDQNEHEKTDGGLGAGTPMFISEVMHGSACIIL